MALNIERMYQHLRSFDFANLFVKELDWSSPVNTRPTSIDSEHTRLEIARLSGIPVFEINTGNGGIPDAQTRDALYKELIPLFRESLLIFLDKERTQSFWYWRKHGGGVSYKREYVHLKGQPEDLFFNKLDSIISDLLAPQEAKYQREKAGLLQQPVSTAIVEAFDEQRVQFMQQIEGIEKERDRILYAMILLCRLMFLYFLQRRGFLKKDCETFLELYLETNARKQKNYYREFLLPLFDSLSTPVSARTKDVPKNGDVVPYLNGGMFSPHRIELDHPAIQIQNEAFSQVFTFFSQYDWQVVDISTRSKKEITPDILGDIFEMYFNKQSQSGAYATPSEITEYFCKQTIQQSILDKMEQKKRPLQQASFLSFQAFLEHLDNVSAEECRYLLFEVLPDLSILDPACGSGTFLLAALNMLLLVYSKLISKIADFHDDQLNAWVSALYTDHSDRMYALKKIIITKNLYGVDIFDEAVELTRLRLYLALISSLADTKNLEPLPDIDFNLFAGNSLVGLLRLDDVKSTSPGLVSSDEETFFVESFRDYNELATTYRESPMYSDDLYFHRADIQKVGLAQKQTVVLDRLNHVLLEQFHLWGRRLYGQTEQQATIADIEHLQPFHWCYYFDQIMYERKGFDIIMTSPQWDVPKDEAPLTFYYQPRFYEFVPQYTHQGSLRKNRVRKNLISPHKLFVEQCYNLLRNDGYCSMIVPSSICTDESAGELRQLLFIHTRITGLFSFENSREILPGVDPRFEFTLLSFEKGQSTETFPSAFSRRILEDLEHFPARNAVIMSVDFIRRFSPDALALGKFRGQRDVSISEKMTVFPSLRETVYHTRNLKVSSGVSLSSMHRLMLTTPKEGTLPVYEGKMIHQFTHLAAPPRYWIDSESLVQEEQRRFSPMESAVKQWQQSEGHGYHLVFRSISSRTNSRTMMATILPPRTFINNTLNFVSSPLNPEELLFLTALFNSFIIDFAVRLRVATRLSISLIYQIPIPHLTRQDAYFKEIVARAARLICTTEDFKALWEGAMRESWSPALAAENQVERNRLCAELDGLAAQVYRITEDDFAYILRSFPLISAPTKIAAQNAYRDMKRGLFS